jgi:hypothetical protein
MVLPTNQLNGDVAHCKGLNEGVSELIKMNHTEDNPNIPQTLTHVLVLPTLVTYRVYSLSFGHKFTFVQV